MKGYLTHTVNYEESLRLIVDSNVIGKDAKPLGYQVPLFKEKPLVFCSFICGGYDKRYGSHSSRPAIIFETESSEVYATPADTFEFMRGGNWLPGHERFIFPSIEKMLEKYPHQNDFKTDFKNFFRRLKSKKVYPNNSAEFAELECKIDYCLKKEWDIGCNEIAFEKPLKIRIVEIIN